MMSVLVESPEGKAISNEGAPEEVFLAARTLNLTGSCPKRTRDAMVGLKQKSTKPSNDGFRVLAVATKESHESKFARRRTSANLYSEATSRFWTYRTRVPLPTPWQPCTGMVERSPLTDLPLVNHQSKNWEIEPFRWIGVRYAQWALGRLDDRTERTGKPPSGRSLAEWISRH